MLAARPRYPVGFSGEFILLHGIFKKFASGVYHPFGLYFLGHLYLGFYQHVVFNISIHVGRQKAGELRIFVGETSAIAPLAPKLEMPRRYDSQCRFGV